MADYIIEHSIELENILLPPMKEKEQEQLSENGYNILKTKGPVLQHYPKKIIC